MSGNKDDEVVQTLSADRAEEPQARRLEVRAMIPTVDQTVKITGPDGRPQRGRVLNAYHSTGGFFSVWIDLDDCLANPANHVAGDCVTGALVLTERDGVYCDLWEGRWELEVIEPG